MIQFYLLSVVLNISGGLALYIDRAGIRTPAMESLRLFFRDRTVRLVLGILSIATGSLKLVTTIRGDIPIVGDFIPASVGITVGLALLLELHRHVDVSNGATVDPADEGKDAATGPSPSISILPRSVESALLENKGAIGIAGAIAGVVHFLFPTVLFL